MKKMLIGVHAKSDTAKPWDLVHPDEVAKVWDATQLWSRVEELQNELSKALRRVSELEEQVASGSQHG